MTALCDKMPFNDNYYEDYNDTMSMELDTSIDDYKKLVYGESVDVDKIDTDHFTSGYTDGYPNDIQSTHSLRTTVYNQTSEQDVEMNVKTSNLPDANTVVKMEIKSNEKTTRHHFSDQTNLYLRKKMKKYHKSRSTSKKNSSRIALNNIPLIDATKFLRHCVNTFDNVCRVNQNVVNRFLQFDSIEPATITILDYVLRFMDYIDEPANLLIYTSIIIDRLSEKELVLTLKKLSSYLCSNFSYM